MKTEGTYFKLTKEDKETLKNVASEIGQLKNMTAALRFLLMKYRNDSK